jgi:deoxycytidine triphosphate deaminase
MAGPVFAADDDAAKARYEKYRNLDPFPEIPPSLLNSADISDYVRVTGMIHPFDPTELKSASYSVRFKGECRYWTPDRTEHVETVGPGDQFTLRKNHIAFVTLEPRFRIPDYIALRFNLQIKFIHKGILVGTGPLVDPGYDGQLFLPLHNLTSNDYQLEVDDGLVWMEFSKISPNEKWDATVKRDEADARPRTQDDQAEIRIGSFAPFPKDKIAIGTMRKYLARAHPGPIQSSIPMEVETARQAAESASNNANNMANRARTWSLLAAVTAAFTVAAILLAVFQTVHSAETFVNESRGETQKVREAVASADERLAVLQDRIAALETEVARLHRAKGPSRP